MSLTVVPTEPDVGSAIEEAIQQRFNLGHLAKLLLSLGEEIGQPHTERNTQDLGLRVKYVANLLASHVEALEGALGVIESAHERNGGDE